MSRTVDHQRQTSRGERRPWPRRRTVCCVGRPIGRPSHPERFAKRDRAPPRRRARPRNGPPDEQRGCPGCDASRVPADLRVSDRLTIPAAELEWRFSRSSGPGGQGVNTTDSRVELTWDIAASPTLSPVQRERALERLAARLIDGTLTVTASEFRSQLRNREAAAARLAALVRRAIAAPPQARRATRPTTASVERRIAAKKRRGRLKKNRRSDVD